MRKNQHSTDAGKSHMPTLAKWFLGIAGSMVLVFGAAYWLLPVNIAPPPAFAATGNKLEKQLQKAARLPDGYQISLFADGINRARLMVETSTGDLIVSSYGSKVFLVSPDRDKNGRADKVAVLLRGLNLSHGVLLDEGWLYVAEQHRVFRVQFDASTGTVSGKRQIVLSGMPADGGHASRTLKKGPDGWFYVSIGSSCNVCREKHPWRASIIRFRPDDKAKPQIYATGLRNTVGIDWQPGTNKLYGSENSRDWLGDDFPPDELNQIEQNGFYGWPYRNGNNVPDPDFGKSFNPKKHGQAQKPAFSFDAHISPLSIRFLKHQKPAKLQNIALVAQHGSWNRSTKNGYRLVALHFKEDGTVSRKMFLTGFLRGKKVIGRPVDIHERANGDLLISDDYNGAIWLVRYKG